MMHTTRIRVENLTQEPLLQLKKNRGKQAIGDHSSSRFQSILRCLTHSLTSPESIQTFTLLKFIQNQIFRVCFVLMFCGVFSRFLGKPIEFPWPESCYTIARVSELDLGLLLIG